MGKIKKVASPKHEATISPALSDFIKKAANLPLIELPQHLASFPTRWDFPRGDLYHWIVPLNRFDEILENFIALYGLGDGPQTKRLGNALLVQSKHGAEMDSSLRQLGFDDDGDGKLVESVLDFSRLLLEKCGNRSLYNSGERLNALLNSTSLPLLHSTLRLALCLAQRYHARHRPTHFHPGSLSVHYGLDLDRMQTLAAPAQKLPTSKKSAPSSPLKASRGKEKHTQHHHVANPNDLLSLSKLPSLAKEKSASQHPDAFREENDCWEEWARIEVLFRPATAGVTTEAAVARGTEPGGGDGSSRLAPPRKQSTDQASKFSRLSSDNTPDGPAPTSASQANTTSPTSHRFEPSVSTLLSSPIEHVVQQGLSTVPKPVYYELLHKLRVAYAVLGNFRTRRQLLAVRILAASNLAYISSDSTFQQRFLAQDREEPKRQQFAYQLADLLHLGSREPEQVPVQLQTHAINALRALTKQKSVIPEVNAALNINANHGILLFVIQKALKDLSQGFEGSGDANGDEMRESLFSLLHAVLISSTPSTRSGEVFASSQLVSSYVKVLTLRTQKARRLYVEVLHFFDAFFHHVKDGLTVLSNNKAFEAIIEMLHDQTTEALGSVAHETAFPAEYRTPSIDYQVPYVHQQTIRSILPFLNGVITQQGPQADRILRSLIDSQTLLSAFRQIVENGRLFGAHIWSEVVKIMSTFLNNEPTSYTIIAEAGLGKSFLETIVLHPLSSLGNSEPSTVSQGIASAVSTMETAGPESDMSVDRDLSGSDIKAADVSCIPENNQQGILPAAEAISNVSQAFSAICLTAAGSDFFQSSGALEKFFETFESPAHIKVMKDASFLQILGNSFDELVRHHPMLKPAVMSAVIVMVSRIRHICKCKAWETGAGAKLWLQEIEGNIRVAGGPGALTQEVLPGLRDSSSTCDKAVYLQLPSGKRLLAATEINRTAADRPVLNETDAEGLTVSDYLTPVTSFLIGLFENPSLCAAFMDAGGMELVLDLATLQSLPFDFCQSTYYGGIPHEIAQVVHMMAETKPHLVLPALLRRILAASKNLESFAASRPDISTCHLSPLVTDSRASLDSSAESIRENGTAFAKNLLVLQLLVNVLSEVFSSPMYHARNREQPAPFTQVNLADLYIEMCQKLAALSAVCYREGKTMEKTVPQEWIDATRPNEPARRHEVEQSESTQTEDTNGVSRPQVIPSDSNKPNGEEAGVPSGDPDFKYHEKTASFKNLRILRRLLFQLPQSIIHLFNQLGHGLIGRKRLDPYQKQNAFSVGGAIAGALIHLLNPPFSKELSTNTAESKSSDLWLSYFVEVLKSCSNVLFDFSTSADHAHCLTVVALPFKTQGGISVLKGLGEQFCQQLESNHASSDTIEIMTAANGGLKSITSILEHLTSAKCIVESSQSNALKSSDRSKPHHFNPAQFLLELRLEALPFVRTIWDSSHAEHASRAVLEKVVTILRHILSGDQEHEAYKNTDRPQILISHPRKKFMHSAEKINGLKSKGFKEDLVREALFRCYNQAAAAEDYCKAYVRDPQQTRNPLPLAEVESPVPVASRASTPEENSARANEHGSGTHPTNTLRNAIDDLGDGQSLLDILGIFPQTELPTSELVSPPGAQPFSAPENREDDENGPLHGIDASAEEHQGGLEGSSSSVPRTAGTKNKQSVPETAAQQAPQATVEMMDSTREQIRSDLAERCLNIINSHNDITWELSDLLKSATKKLSEHDAADFRETACSLLVTSLVSFQSDLEADDLTEATRKKISAYAQFVALLIQDKDIYQECLPHLQGSFDSLLRFVQIPSKETSSETSVPWIALVLLIVERMLSDDAEPPHINWSMPTSIDGPLPTEATHVDKMILPKDEKVRLFDSLLEVLPRICKDNSLALSVARVLVILTRDRQLAVQLSEKRNLQRLFVMMKQLANRANDRIHSSFMLILRHVVEDEDILRQVMRSEIVANFDTRNPRQIDTTAYVRNLYHLVLRSPDTFVQLSKEKLKLQRFDTNQRPQILALKPEESTLDNSETSAKQQESLSTASATNISPAEANSVEGAAVDTSREDAKGKTFEAKPPVVEHPDGVIHFLLSQLLSYRDVDDKESSSTSVQIPRTSPTDTANEVEMGDTFSVPTPQPDVRGPEKVGKPSFTGDDHPIYIYRCFLLQCLTELLHSYNRTKIEFINFSRKSDPQTTTPSKPHSGVLNYLLGFLIPLDTIEVQDSIQFKKRSVTSEWAMKVIVALCTKTGERGLVMGRERYTNYTRVEDNDDDQDLTFVRRFVLEHGLKAFKDANSSNEPLQTRYARILCLANLFHQMLSKPSGNEGAAGSNNTSHKVIAKMMFEKNFIAVLTSSLAEIDLTFPGTKRVVKYILKPLNELTSTAVYLSLNSPTPVSSALGQSEAADISSASSVSEAVDEREETPDLFRNSALGMLDPNRPDESSSESEPEDGDDEMYEGEYADDMEFEEDVTPAGGNDGEVVSDEDVEDEAGPGPMEGLSGDVPMDIELIMDDPHIDLDSDDGEDDEEDGDEDEDEGEDDDDDDDEDEDEEGDDEEDFLIDVDDVTGGGELNADDENESLASGEGTWQGANNDAPADDGDSQDGLEEILDQSSNAGRNTTNGNAEIGEQGSLNNLLNILGENPNGPQPAGGELGELLGDEELEHAMQDLQEEEEEDDDDEDVMDDNDDDLTYQSFNEMLNDPDTPWPWEEGGTPILERTHHHPPPHHHHHFRAAPGQYTSFMSRHITGHGLPMPGIHRSNRVAPPTRPADDGTNPLLLQPGSSISAAPRQTPSPMDMVHGLGPGFIGYLPTGPGTGIGSGGMLDAIMEAMQRGDGNVEMVDPSGRVDIRVDTTPGRFHDMFIRPSFPSSTVRNTRDDPQRIVNFNPLTTVVRWQEEARLLFGMSHIEKAQRVVNALLSVLVPPAIEEEKARLKKAEEERKREEEKRAERERQERRDMEENEEKKREQEKEAAAKAQIETEQAAPPAAAAAAAESLETVPPSSSDAEPMPDVRALVQEDENQGSDEASIEPHNATAGPSQAPAQRVFTTIRGRQLDITNMSIDVEYLEALPEELREEVIMQQYAEQRHQAEEQGQPPTDIDREFLEALPEEIREELLQQEATERRRRERDAARRRVADSGGPPRAEEMDADSFMATLDPALRRSILADQSEEVLNALAPEYAAEARAMMSRQLHHLGGRMPLGRDAREDRVTREQTPGQKEARKQVVQMVDRAGVATLMRLMFMQQQGSARSNLHTILHHICQHRQTRAEVITLLLSILQDGSADVSALEKSLAHLSLRARTMSAQKVPQSLKRTLSAQTEQAATTEMTPLMVVQQSLAALASLTQYNAHVASVFLRELETSALYKSKKNRKSKGKEDGACKFALNALICLLDRRLITENSACMENLSSLLATITQPLTWLLKKDKDKQASPEGEKQSESLAITSNVEGEHQQIATAPIEGSEAPRVQDQAVSEGDTAMVDAPSAGALIGASSENVVAESSDSAPADPDPGEPPKAADETKAKKHFDPPVVPEHNLRLVVGVLAARECNGKTFRDTLSTINNLSLIPGAKDIFGKELISQSGSLSHAILADLNDLLGRISDASSGNDIQSIATAKFSPASADQAKLLRVLTALDYLFDPKRPENNDETTSQPQDVLKSLYESPTFGPLWTKLSECLGSIRQRDGMLGVATILLPLIESLMVVCKNTSLKEASLPKRLREQSAASPAPESGMESLFFNFTTEHRKVLNELVRQNSKLMNGSFSLLAKNPKVLEFDNKRTYFTRQIHSRGREARHPQPPLQLSVRRDQVFLDSFRSLYFKSADEMKYGKLSIRFHGEEGVDAGGVTREWFQVLARGMFNPNYALFVPVASDRTTFHPNRVSGINSEHLMFFKFIGRIIGKALYEGRVLDCHFSRAVYKMILGKTVSIKDMETLDLDYYKSLVWMLENDITDIITETFSIESDDFGESQTIDLIEDGRKIPVTDDNKQEYVQLVVEYRLTGSVQEQLENFLKGFHDIIPAELVSIFTEQELELLISGLPDINVDDWKANTEYHNYSASSPQVQWFWRAVRSFDKEEQAKLLQFVTGTSKVPLNGFKELEGMNGFSRFNIHKDYGNKDRLPSSHTCFNQLDLPEYENYDTLRQSLLTAMLQGSEYFGFA